MNAAGLPQITEGTLILRRWDRQTGLSESPSAFHNLEELFDLCLQTQDPELVDRIVINGLDGDGQPRVLTFTFQSVSISPKK